MQSHEENAISTTLHFSKVWEPFVDCVSFGNLQTWQTFFITQTIIIKTFTSPWWEKSEVKGELVFLNTLLRRNNKKDLCIGI